MLPHFAPSLALFTLFIVSVLYLYTMAEIFSGKMSEKNFSLLNTRPAMLALLKWFKGS